MAVEKSERGEVKRTKDPGVRVVGGRIYDSANGKTCHQCRQKTMDFVASCKILKRDKLCTIKYCRKCLLNRYGENAEEVALLDNWTCPKCRGICNCSFCMKKRGHQPTGILTHTAKASGFSSVSELLQVKGSENFSHQKTVKDIGASPNKSVDSKKEPSVASPGKPGKENCFEGKGDLPKATPKTSEKKSKKTKREGLKEICNVDNDAAMGKISRKRIKVSEEISANFSKKPYVSPSKREEKTVKADDSEVIKDVENNKIGANPKGPKPTHKLKKCATELVNEEFCANIKLPQGISSITVTGIEIPSEDVGNALQFLEFCLVFGKVLDLRKGQAEAVLRELMRGRSRRRQEYSSVIQIHAQLLSVIQKDRGEKAPSSTDGKNSWLNALAMVISESECQLKEFSAECLDKGLDGYENLHVSKKLKLLNFLCEEALCTTALRSWIDEQNSESSERAKEAKEKVAAAKEKEKQLKLKLQDKVAKAVIAKNGAPLSVSEHEAIVSQIKAKTAAAHAEMLEAMGMLSKERQRCAAVRTDPVILDDNGRVFWRLKSYDGESNILLQDLGTWGEVSPNEKWVAFDAEAKPEVEKYISCLRVKRFRAQKLVAAASVASSERTN